MKCCPNTIVSTKKGYLQAGGFSFPYLIDYCGKCGVVKGTTFIHDGKPVDIDWETR